MAYFFTDVRSKCTFLHSVKLDPGLTSQFIELAADVLHQVWYFPVLITITAPVVKGGLG